ncbi:MAG TPA: hypothetical protein VNI01_07570 [Elusimicrobiota bacterium]|nr:hypothetical protein [Elusimicrobiota bacterium]
MIRAALAALVIGAAPRTGAAGVDAEVFALGDTGWSIASPAGFPAASRTASGHALAWTSEQSAPAPGQPEGVLWSQEEEIRVAVLRGLRWSTGQPSPVPCRAGMRPSGAGTQGENSGQPTFDFSCAAESMGRELSREHLLLIPGRRPPEWRGIHLRYFRRVRGAPPAGLGEAGEKAFRGMRASLGPVPAGARPAPAQGAGAAGSDSGKVPLLR